MALETQANICDVSDVHTTSVDGAQRSTTAHCKVCIMYMYSMCTIYYHTLREVDRK